MGFTTTSCVSSGLMSGPGGHIKYAYMHRNRRTLVAQLAGIIYSIKLCLQRSSEVIGRVKPPPPPLGGNLFHSVVGPHQLTFLHHTTTIHKEVSNGQVYVSILGKLYVLLLEHLRATTVTV